MSIHDSYIRYIRGAGPGGDAAGIDPLWNLTIPLGWVGAAYARFRNLSYDRGWSRVRSPALPVIGVGNLTLGGTSKTPCVAWIAEELSDALGGPESVGLLTRGYTGSGDPRLFRAGQATRGEVGDEALLLSNQHPQSWVAVGRDRLHGAEQLAGCGAQIAVADDVFQHRRLGRVFDLVLIDAEVPFGNRRVIPAGWLREPIDGLERATAVLLTRTTRVGSEVLDALKREVGAFVPRERIFSGDLAVDGWSRLNSDPGYPTSAAEPPGLPSRGFCFSAIARPAAFFDTLEALGYEVVGKRKFRDHHVLTMAEVRALDHEAVHSGADWISCTEKDLFNLPPTWQPQLPLYVPTVRLSVEEGPALVNLICSRSAIVRKER